VDTENFSAIWAPWRVEYFSRKTSSDFLSDAAQTDDDAAHLVVARRKNSFLIMNRFPYAVGHMMAAPYQKVGRLDALDAGTKLELWELAEFAQRLLTRVVSAQGFNLGLNLGRCAGAGVIDHLHLHIVPRWEGDNNFMPVLANTRVLPEALDALYAKLMTAVAEEIAPSK
jgi:ATP adenylyltransferase